MWQLQQEAREGEILLVKSRLECLPQVLSDSCLAVSPGWTSRPFIQQTGEATLR